MTRQLYVCVGSSCHLKGSYDIITCFRRLIEETNADVVLHASFCLGHCSEGVSVKLDETLHTGITPENAETFFRKEVLG